MRRTFRGPIAAYRLRHLDQPPALPECVFTRIVALLDVENLAQDLQIVGDFEGVPRVVVAEEVEEVVKPAPCDGREAERTGFVGRDKNAVLRIGPAFYGQLVESVEG